MQKQHDVGIGNGVPGTCNAHLLDHVLAVAQAGGVDDVDRYTFNLDGLLDLVTRGAGNGRHYGQLGTGQGVEERGLAGIGLPGNDHADAFAQQGALARLLQDQLQTGKDVVELALGIGFLQEVDLFFGKIQRGLDQHAQVDEGVLDCMDAPGKYPGQRLAGTTRRRLGAGVNQVGNRLGLGQIELVVEEGALGKFTRLG